MEVSVSARPRMSSDQRRRAVQRIEELERLAPGPVLAAGVRLRCDDNPRIPHRFHAEGQLDVNGRLVRAHVAGPSADAALDRLVERLARQLREVGRRYVARRHDGGAAQPGAWRHGSAPAPRPAFFPRPADDRRVVRRKSVAAEARTPVEAAADMLDLDHDFYVFRDAATGADAVIHRLRDDGRFGLVAPAGATPDADERWLVFEADRFGEPVDLQTAVDDMDATGHRFVFFLDRSTGRGSVVYRRYDGHYGVIAAAA